MGRAFLIVDEQCAGAAQILYDLGVGDTHRTYLAVAVAQLDKRKAGDMTGFVITLIEVLKMYRGRDDLEDFIFVYGCCPFYS